MNELNAEDAEQAFQRFTHDPIAAPAVFLVARGDLNLYTDTYTPPDDYPSDELTDRHNQIENLSKGEGKRHLRAKLLGASYLESEGFDVQRKSSEPLEYDCFEEKIEGHDADVVADSESGTVCLEAGYVECDYLLGVFGYKKLRGGYAIETLKEHLIRDTDPDVSHFITSPYRDISTDEVRYYIFERTEDIAEPTHDASRRVADALDEIR